MDSALRFLHKLQLFKVFAASFLSDVTSCIMGNREMFARSLSVSSVSSLDVNSLVPPPATAGQQQRNHHHQPGGWCVLRADYPGRRVLFCACGLWDCTLCVFLIRPQRGLSPAADCRAEPSLSETAALIFFMACWHISILGLLTLERCR